MVHDLERTPHHQVSLEVDASALRQQLRLRSQERPGLVLCSLAKVERADALSRSLSQFRGLCWWSHWR